MLVATVLEDINVKFASTREVAIVIVATTPEVVDVEVAQFLVNSKRLHWHIRLPGQPVLELWYSLLQLYWLL